MAEAILKHVAPGEFEVLSAGAWPTGYIHPLVFAALEPVGIPVEDQRSKSWEEFRSRHVDLLVTVCDAAADEVCPVWPDRPTTVHWPLPDPVMSHGSDEERVQAAQNVAARLTEMLRQLAALDWGSHDATELREQIQAIATDADA
jgi:arsenate reductase